MKKIIIALLALLIVLGFAIKSCEACSECQGAIKKGETPPKYERKKWKLPALTAHMKLHDQTWEKVTAGGTGTSYRRVFLGYPFPFDMICWLSGYC